MIRRFSVDTRQVFSSWLANMMWGHTIVAISVLLVAQVSVAQESVAHSAREAILDSPYAIEIGFESNTSVSVTWKFATPPKVSMEDVTFVIKLHKYYETRARFDVEFREEPLRQMLFDLEPSKLYRVTVQAKCEGFESSAPASANFDTVSLDWYEPTIPRVSSKVLVDSVESTVFWELDHTWSTPTSVQIEFCALDCKTMTVSGSAFEATVTLGFGIPFNATVIADYSSEHAHLVTRRSSNLNGYTPVGRPGRIGGLKSFKESGEFLEIEWEPPVSPRGPATQYSVEILDPLIPSRKNRENVTEPSVHIKRPKLLGKMYQLIIRPFNVDHDDVSYSGPFTSFQLSRELPPLSEKIEILERTPYGIRFKVSHNELDMTEFVEVHTEDPSDHVGVSATEANVSVKYPYSKVNVEARLCDVDQETEIEYCGERVRVELRSNVGEPSPVQSVRLTHIRGECYEVKWGRPSEPNGPIDGYSLEITDGTWQVPIETYASELKSTTRLVCNRLHWTDEPPKLLIAAFNYDLQNGSIRHIGEFVSTPLGREHKSHSIFDPTFTRVLVLLVATVISYLFTACTFKDGLIPRVDRAVPKLPKGRDVPRTPHQGEALPMPNDPDAGVSGESPATDGAPHEAPQPDAREERADEKNEQQDLAQQSRPDPKGKQIPKKARKPASLVDGPGPSHGVRLDKIIPESLHSPDSEES